MRSRRAEQVALLLCAEPGRTQMFDAPPVPGHQPAGGSPLGCESSSHQLKSIDPNAPLVSIGGFCQ